jgi:FkbM family methyltransferase
LVLESRKTPWGDTIWFEPSDISIDPAFLQSGIAWPHELEALATMVRPGDLVIDAGANLGYLSCYLAYLVGPSGKVRAIEPNEAMATLLERNISHNSYSTIVVDRLALGNSDGTAQLWISKTNLQRHSIYSTNVPNVVSTEIVPQLTADTYWRRYLDERPVGLLKVDVEGAERLVLKFGQRLLTACREIWMEFWPDGIARDGNDPYECLELLRNAGFALTRWDLVSGEHESVADGCDIKSIIGRLIESELLKHEGLSPLLYLHGTRRL